MGRDSVALVTSIGSYLGANGVGTLGNNLWLQYAPDDPITTTVVFHTGGPLLRDSPTRYPGFAVHHRNTNVTSGLATATKISSLLHNRWNVLSGFTGRITADSEAGSYYTDPNGHYVFPLAFSMTTTDQR